MLRSSLTSKKTGLSHRKMSFWCAGVVIATLVGCAAPVAVSPPPEPPQPEATRAPRWALALGGGAARGFAHVGVIQVLENEGLLPDVVLGTSAGSLVAGLYAIIKNSP